MRDFKLKQGSNQIYTIDKEIFEKVTFGDEPYYNRDSKGKETHFAICPQCDNPIEIIGLYKKLKNTERPYGRHYPQSVKNLAKYNQQTYDYCPYAKKQKNVNHKMRKAKLGEYEKGIYNLMREQFDRAVYILEKKLDIKIGLNTAKKMLLKYIAAEAWLYPWSTYNNLPWMFGYFARAQSLDKKLILRDSPLYKAIVKSCPNAKFTPYNKYKKYDILEEKIVNHLMLIIFYLHISDI